MNEYNRHNFSEVWGALWLKIWGHETRVARCYFPRTLALLRETPLSTAMISLLEPYRGVKWHKGFINIILRYHVGIRIPLS